MRCCVGADPLTSLVWGVTGLAVGTSLNSVIWRLAPSDRPEDISEESDKQWFVRDSASCEKCGARLSIWQSTGLLALFARRLRCPQCGRPLVIARIVVELACALIWMLSLRSFGATLNGATAAFFLSVLLGIAIADFRSWIIPHEFTWSGILIGLALSVERGITGLVGTLVGAFVGPAVFFAAAWFVKVYKRFRNVTVDGRPFSVGDALGGGDYWLISTIGVFVGWRMVPVAIVLSGVSGLLVALPREIWAKIRRQETPKTPFGVFLALGGAATLLVGDRLISWYMAWVLGR